MSATEEFPQTRDGIPLALITAAWMLYLLVIPFEELVQGAPLYWLLLFNAGSAFVIGVLAIVQHSWWSRFCTVFFIGTLWLLYVIYWAEPILELSPYTQLSFPELVQSIAYTKVRFIEEFFSNGRVWASICKAIWEIMPFLQFVLVVYWASTVFLRRQQNHSGTITGN
jgi:hypothetical protein